MFGLSATAIKLIVVGIVIAILIGLFIKYRDSLIQMGKNVVYAEDNAARVEAQDKQIKDDANRVVALNAFIDQLQIDGSQIKEKIRVVQGPCTKDGADDVRLREFNQWLRTRPAYDNGTSGNRLAPQTAVPAPSK